MPELYSKIKIDFYAVTDFSQKKIGRWLQQAKDIKSKFERRRKAKNIPYHEEKLHKFDR